MTALDRFLAKVTIDTASECWIWTATKSHNGYGQFKFEGKMRQAHRVAYEMFVGPIPEGLHIDHLCRNRACVNPGHLEPVTNAENVRRGEGPTAINARKTVCSQGHSLDDAYRYKDGRRDCRQCRRGYMRRFHERRRQAEAA